MGDPLSTAIHESLQAVLGGFDIHAKKLNEASRNAAQAVLSITEDDQLHRIRAGVLAAALMREHLAAHRYEEAIEAMIWEPTLRFAFLAAATKLSEHMLDVISPERLLSAMRPEIVAAVGQPFIAVAAAEVSEVWKSRVVARAIESLEDDHGPPHGFEADVLAAVDDEERRRGGTPLPATDATIDQTANTIDAAAPEEICDFGGES